MAVVNERSSVVVLQINAVPMLLLLLLLLLLSF